MPFVKGGSKPAGSGRKKGQLAIKRHEVQPGNAPRHTPLTAKVADRLAALGCDPIEILAKVAMDKNHAIELRVSCAKELASYVYPKLKAIEHTGLGGGAAEAQETGVQALRDHIAMLATSFNSNSAPN